MFPGRYKIYIIVSLLVLVLLINCYLITIIGEDWRLDSRGLVLMRRDLKNRISNMIPNSLLRGTNTGDFIEKIIINEIEILPLKYFDRCENIETEVEKILLQTKFLHNATINIVDNVNRWPSHQHLLPSYVPLLGLVIESLRHSKVLKADNAKVGTQLKLMLDFENGLKAIFKPRWYDRDTKIEGLVYNGKDRHNAEVVAFYLSLLLSWRRAPLSLIRKLDLFEEVEKKATPELRSTMYRDNGNICFYGVCHYCNPKDPICANKNILEGTLILWLPPQWELMKLKNPWQRTYSKNRIAVWEKDVGYCDKVKRLKSYSLQSSKRLLDLIDTAIFDFLMDNGDRHHYEVFKGNFKDPVVLLIDNGKSFGNPEIDHLDILAPLIQCCVIHRKTWDRLQLLKGGCLSYSLEKLLARESIMGGVPPILTSNHLKAIDRRLLIVFAAVEHCLKMNKFVSDVIIG